MHTVKNIVENGLETQNFEKILFLQFFPASIFLTKILRFLRDK